MHVSCMKGQEAIVELLIARAREHSLMNEVVNAKTIKVYTSSCCGLIHVLLELSWEITSVYRTGGLPSCML